MREESGGSRQDFYERYVSTHTGQRAMGAAQWFPALDYLPQSRSGRVLDLGCGEGSLIREIQAMGFSSVSGIDISQEQIALAHERGTNQVQVADVFEFLPSNPSKWSVITTVDVLEHFTPDEVSELAPLVFDALSPGGIWIAQVPNAVSPLFGNYAYGDFTHRTVFTPRSMAQITRLAGFEVEGAYPVAVAPGGGVKRVMRRLIYRGYESMVKLALAAETGQSDLLVSQNIVFVARRPPEPFHVHSSS